jgi:hypothetical protein
MWNCTKAHYTHITGIVTDMIKKLAFHIIPVQIFLGFFWFKNGFIDKVCGIVNGLISPATSYRGDTWIGWKEYIVGTWDKSQVTHVILSPFFDILFPVLIILQCLPFIFIIISILKFEFLNVDTCRPWLMKGAIASLFVTSVMLFSQTLSGASDGEYLWHLLAAGMVLVIYIKTTNNLTSKISYITN